MDAQLLVVSDPPHRDVDHEAVATVLGLTAEEARLKMLYTAPEVMLAWDPDRALDFAASLRATGANVALIDGRGLVDVPWPTLVDRFELGPEALRVHAAGSDREIPYGAELLAVYSSPPPGFSGGGANDQRPASEPEAEGPASASAIEWTGGLDLYDRGEDGAVRRHTLSRDLTDFSGLGPAAGSMAPEARMRATIAELRARVPGLRLDDRLEHVRPRRRFVGGEVEFDLDMRKLYSFGTLLLRSVMESISPELRDLTHYELGSRLAYVLSR